MTTAWHRGAVIYSLDVETFQDSDGDGIGDFTGLTQRLDYVADLGIDCVWLLPFYPTPNRDDGYDVADYCAIDPRLGSLADFRNFVRAAQRRGIRVLIELVVNHTSTAHPWFQAARRDPHSPYRDYYIWIDQPPKLERRGGPVFPGEQSSNWSYDEVADAYYWHWFYDHQPDLNTSNPAVRGEIREILRFWLDLGVSGFRIDAAPFLFKRKGLSASEPDDPEGFLLELREYLRAHSPDAIFLAEADVSTDELQFFLGEGERMHLVLNFILNNYLFLALGREDGEPLRRAYAALPSCPAGSTWANFIRNHDELNLDRLAREERDELFAKFATNPTARIYGRGIRRRLAPMLQGDRQHMELVYALLFSLPGVPVIRYGDEIGMGDDLSLSERLTVRTPMQWSADPGAGFSDAPRGELIRPIVSAQPFAPSTVNVQAQCADRHSLLHFMKRLIAIRRATPLVGRGDFRVLDVGDSRVFAHRFSDAGGTTFHLHNMSREAVEVRLVVEEGEGEGEALEPDDLLADRDYLPLEPGGGRFTLGGYGVRWLYANRVAPGDGA